MTLKGTVEALGNFEAQIEEQRKRIKEIRKELLVDSRTKAQRARLDDWYLTINQSFDEVASIGRLSPENARAESAAWQRFALAFER